MVPIIFFSFESLGRKEDNNIYFDLFFVPSRWEV